MTTELNYGRHQSRKDAGAVVGTEHDICLSGSPEEALARPYSADAMRIVQSGADREDLLRAA